MRKIIGTGLMLSIVWLIAFEAIAQSTIDQKIAELAQELSDEFPAGRKTKLAIIGFDNTEGRLKKFRGFVRTELTKPLRRSGKFSIIVREEAELDKVITEQKRSLTGLFDPAAAKNLGQLWGADVLLVGTVISLGPNSKIRVAARCIDIRTGEAVAESSVDIPRLENYKELFQDNFNEESPNETGNIPPGENVKLAPSNIEVRLLKCRRDDNNVICALRLTNKDDTKPVNRVRFSSGGLMDEQSNKAALKQILKSGQHASYFDIVSGGSLQLDLVFQGVSLKARRAELIALRINGGEIVFSNACLVPLCGS